jgi:hypothetical protein
MLNPQLPSSGDNIRVPVRPHVGPERPNLTILKEFCRAWFSTQTYVKSDFMSISLLTFVGRTSTLKHLV